MELMFLFVRYFYANYTHKIARYIVRRSNYYRARLLYDYYMPK